MCNRISSHISIFFRFMRLFGITMFSIVRTESDRIHAIVAWEEDCQEGLPDREDTQEVLWICNTDVSIEDALIVGEYAYDVGWISSDTILIDEDKLHTILGWEKGRITKAVDKLMRIRVSTIDDDEETDMFFLHQ